MTKRLSGYSRRWPCDSTRRHSPESRHVACTESPYRYFTGGSTMSTTKSTSKEKDAQKPDDRGDMLRASPMMAHLLGALEAGTDVGHYGRLTFVMIARHFMDEEEMVKLLARQPDQDETTARALVMQVKAKDYSPPKRDRILQWQAQQDFPIIPN